MPCPYSENASHTSNYSLTENASMWKSRGVNFRFFDKHCKVIPTPSQYYPGQSSQTRLVFLISHQQSRVPCLSPLQYQTQMLNYASFITITSLIHWTARPNRARAMISFALLATKASETEHKGDAQKYLLNKLTYILQVVLTGKPVF